MFKYIKQTEFNTNEVYNSMWKFDQQICQQIDFPVALDLGCKYLFSHIGDIFVSKDGKYCIAQTYRYVEKMLCIYELPYWRLDLVFYDFTSGYVVQTLTCKIYKQLRELQIIGNHLALKEGDNYFGWLIK